METYDLMELYRQLMIDYEKAPKVYVYPLDDCNDYHCEQPSKKRWRGKRKKKTRKQ